MPNRIFEYMASGLPTVAPSYSKEMKLLIPKYKCGLLCDTENPDELSAALFTLWTDKNCAREMGKSGRKAFKSELNWAQESTPLLDWIQTAPEL